jgi:ABC-type uncharacterized transport system permease subunit
VKSKVTRFLSQALRAMAAEADTLLGVVGLVVLTVSVAQWSRPAAGVLVGVALMAAAVFPLFFHKRQS